MAEFNNNLTMGRVWEERVSVWLQENQHYVLNVYEYTPTKSGVSKAPKLQTLPADKSLVLPDLQAAQSGVTHWIEVKSKNSCGQPFSHYPAYRTTGIDLKYWHDYLEVQEVSGIEVYIFFVHVSEGEVRTASLNELDSHERKYIHRGNEMVYWPYDELRVVAKIDEHGNIFAIEDVIL